MDNTLLSESNDSTNELFKFTVNYVYEKIVSQFLNDNGNCDPSIFWLTNWNIICDNRNIGIKIILVNLLM